MTTINRDARLLACVAAVVLLLSSARAEAYAWMISHDFAGCNACHADPSGGGLLTQYGRAQGEILLRTRYGATDEEAGKVADFLFGVVPLPDALLLGGDVRALEQWIVPRRGPSMAQFVWMQSDLAGQLSVGRVRANASIGYSHRGALPAAITHNDVDNVISRVHWLGVDIGEDREWLLRGGRMNLPFGIRFVEHTFGVRQTTRTDINDQQQHGAALAYNVPRLRAEVMAVLGNYQIHPDMYRSRGGVGYVEIAPGERLALGVSALVLHANRDWDPLFAGAAWRQAYALSARYATPQSIVLLAEGDLLVASPRNRSTEWGYASVLQADWEAIQGLHFVLTGEAADSDYAGSSATYTGWASVGWFFAPHADARIDLVEQSYPLGTTANRTGVTSILAQLHVFL